MNRTLFAREIMNSLSGNQCKGTLLIKLIFPVDILVGTNYCMISFQQPHDLSLFRKSNVMFHVVRNISS